jgi:hypothetical protein
MDGPGVDGVAGAVIGGGVGGAVAAAAGARPGDERKRAAPRAVPAKAPAAKKSDFTSLSLFRIAGVAPFDTLDIMQKL